jgi:hypothetical protein
MENKYYTPGISEFHVGFDLELFNGENGQWGRYTIGDAKDICNFQECIYGEYENLRVKYLDEEDIESLGFVRDWSKDFIIEANDRTYRLSPYYNMRGDVRETLVRIYIVDPKSHSSIDEIFRGDIKNKSELIKLLKQLGIN